MLSFCLFALAATTNFVGAVTPRCVDENGANVDWFVGLKVNNAYAYSLATSAKRTMTTSAYTLDNASKGAISLTIQQSFDTSVTAIYWNDEDPAGNSHNTFGHDKGIIAFDKTGGYWLIHSTPRFPDTTQGKYGGFPSYAVTYGQSFMCITLTPSTINTVANMLQWARPYVFSSRVVADSIALAPNINALIAGTAIKDPLSSQISFKSAAGQTFYGWGTTSSFNQDIYYTAAMYFKSAVRAETWMNGINPLPSFCTPTYLYNTVNIRSVGFAGKTWLETQDHSKWALTNNGYVCFGGKNRQLSQTSRQGELVCFAMPDLWSSLNAGILTYDQCPSELEKENATAW